jgi:hypothetical protein
MVSLEGRKETSKQAGGRERRAGRQGEGEKGAKKRKRS